MSSTRAQSSLSVPDLQNYPGGLFGLGCPIRWLLPPSPAILFPRGLNERGYHEQLQQQHQQKQQALDPRFPVPSWAGAAPGVSWVVDICRLRISVRSDPMGCKTAREGGSKKHLSFFFSLPPPALFALKVLRRSAEGHSSEGTGKLNAWFFFFIFFFFFPTEGLECWILWKIYSFKCCDGRQRANEFEYKEKRVVMRGAKGGSEGSWRAAALSTGCISPGVEKGFLRFWLQGQP